MRVICVDDSPGSANGAPSMLVKWKEYTIIRECRAFHHNEEVGVILAEVSVKETDEYCICYRPERFRPIKEIDVNAMFRCEEMVNT